MATSESGWREQVLADYRAQRARLGRSQTAFGKALRPLQLNATRRFLAFVDRAAQARDVNRSSYIRRAVGVVVANDLGIDVRIILYESPAVAGYGSRQMRTATGGARDTGEDIEGWCPHPGCDGAHLQPDA